MKRFRRKYKKERYKPPKLKENGFVRVKHKYVHIEGKFLFFNFTKKRFRIRLPTDVELWVNVEPDNKHVLEWYENYEKPKRK